MAMPNELQSVLNPNSGIVTTAQANEVGVSNERLRLLVHSGDLERVTTGIYVLQELRQKAHTELAGFSRGMNGACVAKHIVA